jgi:hypothetical protein
LALDAERRLIEERSLPGRGELRLRLIEVEDEILAVVPVSAAGAAVQLRLLQQLAQAFD